MRRGWVRTGKPRRSYRRIAAGVILWGLIIAGVALLACAFYAGPRDYNGSTVSKPSPQQSTVEQMAHPVFALSVVPGGVWSPADVKRVTVDDYIVRTLYNSVNFGLVHEHRTKLDMAVYVSYRRGQHVFWTKGAHTIKAGERLYTDGAHMIRGRCGNLLSLTPRYPTEPVEPTVQELDGTISISTKEPATMSLHSGLLTPPVLVPRGWVIGNGGGGGLGGHPCRHEDDGDSDDCHHGHHNPPPPVPEPSTWLLMGTGFVIVVWGMRRHATR